MCKVSNVAQMRIQLAHYLYNCPGTKIAFLPLLNCAAKLYHPLYISAIFRYDRVLLHN